MAHPDGGVSGRKIVDAEMDERFAKGDGPFGGDGGDREGAHDVEVEPGGDGIVIGKGDEGGKLEEVLDLAAFERLGVGGGERRGPPSAGVVELFAIVGTEGGFVLPNGLAHPRDMVGIAGEKSHVLFRVHRVAVEGHTGAKLVGNARVAPEKMKTMGKHGIKCDDLPLQSEENRVNFI